jgi:hypothetical protein
MTAWEAVVLPLNYARICEFRSLDGAKFDEEYNSIQVAAARTRCHFCERYGKTLG